MKLIPDWKQAPRWFSTQAMAFAGILQAAWFGIPDDLKASVPQEWVAGLTAALMVLGILGRIVDQPK